MTIAPQEWEILLNDVAELSSLLENNIVFIGGIGVYFHSLKTQNGLLPLESSHDADFSISQVDFADLRDLYEVTKNKRLNKSQIMIHENEYDIYVEKQNHLKIDFDELFYKSQIIKDIRVPCLEHLLVLKLEAYKDRKYSQKGAKDERDLIKILFLLNNEFSYPEELNKYLTDDDKTIIRDIVEHSKQYTTLTDKNQFLAKQIKMQCVEFTSKLNKRNNSLKP